ncbi:MAG: flagellar protein export ATPase FliI [Oscillospiraceae bacterium]|nr:flagellar protein export ATPase FliI [Oscillospiraceae bacterium]RKJ58607.1 flagellar protein export ATPase FliI [bacterium 1XD42-8]RKJ67666.1 flagellar protein export ATPase FliI [bacterium 1XD42-1]
MDIAKYRNAFKINDFYTHMGKIDKIVGMTVEATGPNCNIGDVCKITIGYPDKTVLAEVVGFKENKVLLMPYQDTEGIGYGSSVTNTGEKLMIHCSDDLIGRTVDALGKPIDGGPPIEGGIPYSIQGEPSNPMDRPRIETVIEMGVRAIDGFLTIGKGQRMGIFAGSGVGKSTLMGMLARNVKADINVIALVGERGREVVEFMERDLGPEGRKRSVLVVATSDQPAMMRNKCAMTATSIAEYFRDQGKDVLLMMDSLTRFCMAQREIGLSIGEPPVARGYTPSIYTALPKLLERSGNFEKGSITGIYTVLVEGDDTNEPIADTVRGIIDGHIILSRKIAVKNHYPAIDVLGSISRLMNDIADRDQVKTASQLRNMLSIYEQNQDLISIGAYKRGTNPVLDNAISHIDRINDFLQQAVGDKVVFQDTVAQMKAILN